MMRPRRSGALAIACAFSALALAACSSSGGGGSEASDTTAPTTGSTASSGSSASAGAATSSAASGFGVNATGTVQFWARNATDPVAKQMVKEFNASHPNLKVVLTETQPNQAVTKLATALRAGSPPDLIGLNDINMSIFTHTGQFMDLTDAVNALPYKDALSPGHLNLATYKGHYYGVPYLADLSLLWYNKTLFQKAGLDPNKPPTTFAEILSDAQAIQKLGNGVYGFSFAGNCQGCLGFTMLPSVWASNTHLISGDIGSQKASVEGNQALQSLLTLYQQIWSQHLAPPADRSQDGSTWGKDFLAGKIGMLPQGYGMAGQFGGKGVAIKTDEIGAAPLPGPDGGVSTFDGGDDFAIPNGAKNASGAWEFVTWVLDKQQQEEFPGLGFTPVRTDVLDQNLLQKYPYDAVALDALKTGFAPVTNAYNQIFNQASGPWFAMFSKAVYDGDVAGAMKSGQQGFDQVLSQAGS